MRYLRLKTSGDNLITVTYFTNQMRMIISLNNTKWYQCPTSAIAFFLNVAEADKKHITICILLFNSIFSF